MRLIDADALLLRLKSDPLYHLLEQYNISGLIEEEPTVSIAPALEMIAADLHAIVKLIELAIDREDHS